MKKHGLWGGERKALGVSQERKNVRHLAQLVEKK